MNIVWIDLLQLDRCDEHGVWLDPGKMQRALNSKHEFPKGFLAPPKH
jgi:hypothetical protein